MADSHAIAALVHKRAELSGMILDLDRQRAALRSQMHHVDHALAILGYGKPPRDIRPKQPKTNRFQNRELSIFLRELARDGERLTNREAALRMIAKKGWGH